MKTFEQWWDERVARYGQLLKSFLSGTTKEYSQEAWNFQDQQWRHHPANREQALQMQIDALKMDLDRATADAKHASNLISNVEIYKRSNEIRKRWKLDEVKA